MAEPSSTLESIIGSAKYQRFLSREQKVIDLKNIAAVAAELHGWQPEFNALAHAKIETTLPNGNIHIINFGRAIKSSKFSDDSTEFRPHFTVLYAVNYLADKFAAQFGGKFNGITAQTVMHYTNISVSDSYNCLVRLAKEGFVVRGNVHELLEYIAISEKVEKERGNKPKLEKLSARKQKEAAAIKLGTAQAITKLTDAMGAEKQAILRGEKTLERIFAEELPPAESGSDLRKQVVEKYYLQLAGLLEERHKERLAALDKKYVDLEASLKTEITPAERELWTYSKSLPKLHYGMSEKGCKFLQKVAEAHPIAAWHIKELLQEADKRISLLNPLHGPTSMLSLAHIPEDRLEDISFGVFREMLNEWSQLPEDRILLFQLYSAPFVFTSESKKEIRELSYAGPRIEQGKFLASVYVDANGQIIAHDGQLAFPLGVLSMPEQDEEKFRNSAVGVAANLAKEIPQKYGAELIGLMRNDTLCLGNSEAEVANCKRFGLWADTRVRPFDTTFGIRRTESIKLYQEQTRITIPEALSTSYSILFLPRRFDPRGITWHTD